MENEYLKYKSEIEKINKRVKEYLWKKWYLFRVKKKQSKNIRKKFLAR